MYRAYLGGKMNQDSRHERNVILLRGATLWLLMALVLAWCLVGTSFGVPFITMIFKGFHRLLQAHIDFLLMSALIFGVYSAKVPLPSHVCWAMVIGAFTNSSMFLLMSMFPILLDAKAEDFAPEGMFPMLFHVYLFASISITTYGFGRGAVIIFQSTFKALSD
jgi:hypothetical protein